MDGDTRTTFGFSDNDAITVESIKRLFKKNVVEGNAVLADISANGLILLKSLANSSDHSVLRSGVLEICKQLTKFNK